MSAPLSAEGAVLHAVLDNAPDRALELLADFLPGELVELARACWRLEVLIGAAQRGAEAVEARRVLGRGPQ